MILRILSIIVLTIAVLTTNANAQTPPWHNDARTIFGWIDTPTVGEAVSGGAITVHGWAFACQSGQQPWNIKASFIANGERINLYSVRISPTHRPDAGWFGRTQYGCNNNDYVGFALCVYYTSKFAPGKYQLVIEFSDSYGAHYVQREVVLQ